MPLKEQQAHLYSRQRNTAGQPPVRRQSQTQPQPPQRRRASQPADPTAYYIGSKQIAVEGNYNEEDLDDDEGLPVTTGRSAIVRQRYLPAPVRQQPYHYAPAVQPRRTYQQEPPPPVYVKPVSTRRLHWLVWLGVGMMAAIALGSLVLPGWLQQKRDDWAYGMPRTSHAVANVGHSDPLTPLSYFTAENLHGKIWVMEVNSGDPNKYPPHDYFIGTLVGDGNDLIPVTLRFEDVNGDGKLDMIIEYNNTQVIFYNTGKTFSNKPA